MRKLGTMKLCPKCREWKFSVRYVAPVTYRDIQEPYTLEDEYMEVICDNCGYIQKELPHDYTENKN